MENTRLGIPILFHEESLHGLAAKDATAFPQAIGLAATWNEPLFREMAVVIGNEGRAKHHQFVRQGQRLRYQGLTFWSPNINIFRDPRWGRVEELVGAAVFWLGMQRNDAVLRWSGLAILIATTAYVFFLTFTRLQGVAQFGSALGLAVVLMGVAWFARTNRKPPEAGDLVNVTPGARRERRGGRRQRTP
ncbi:MAG: hypothetical protein HC767_13415 [Akkermansiaceae bacterium]|nr:hypothetical protein [Akkermansiaceae bacterium]